MGRPDHYSFIPLKTVRLTEALFACEHFPAWYVSGHSRQDAIIVLSNSLIIFLGYSLSLLDQYGPVTMIVPASDHQVRSRPWVQRGTFNREIGFLCWLKFFVLNIFCG